MTDAKYVTTTQPISIYGYRFSTVTVIEKGTTETTVTFDHLFKPLAKIDGTTITAGTTAVIPANTAAGTTILFLGQ